MIKIFIQIIILFLLNVSLYATQEIVLKIVQPILTENGIQESISTYVYFINYRVSAKISLTCEENYIKTESTVGNRNIANICGLKIKFSRITEWGYPVFGDTVKADLIIPNEKDISLNDYGVSFEDIINATIKCMIKNAAAFNFLNYLDLNVVGESKYLKFSKVYKLRD
jgi:hypothetical protein